MKQPRKQNPRKKYLNEKEREKKLIKSARQMPVLTKMESSSPIRFMTNTELEEECRRFHESSRSSSSASSSNSTQASSSYKQYRPSPLITRQRCKIDQSAKENKQQESSSQLRVASKNFEASQLMSMLNKVYTDSKRRV